MPPAAVFPPASVFLAALLWQGELGEQREAKTAGEVCVVPAATRLGAFRLSDGKPRWRYSMRERHGLLDVLCRIQAVEVYPSPPPRVPGLPPPPRSGKTKYLVCVAGQSELVCLAAATGSIRWRRRKADGCVLALYRVGDLDFDGTEDLVCCGCNLAECYSGRTGVVFWRYRVSGRSLWAGPCGDLDGDGFGEVLLQSGTALEVISSPEPDRVGALFPLGGSLPAASAPCAGGTGRAFWVVFPGTSVWRWRGDGKGVEVWKRKAEFRAFDGTAGLETIVTADGVWRLAADGTWKRLFTGTIAKASCASGRAAFTDGKGKLFVLFPGARKPRAAAEIPGRVDRLVFDRTGKFLAVFSADTLKVYRIDEKVRNP